MLYEVITCLLILAGSLMLFFPLGDGSQSEPTEEDLALQGNQSQEAGSTEVDRNNFV